MKNLLITLLAIGNVFLSVVYYRQSKVYDLCLSYEMIHIMDDINKKAP